MFFAFIKFFSLRWFEECSHIPVDIPSSSTLQMFHPLCSGKLWPSKHWHQQILPLVALHTPKAFLCLLVYKVESQTHKLLSWFLSPPLFFSCCHSFSLGWMALRETCELLVTAARRSNTSHDLSPVCMVGGLPARAATSSNTLLHRLTLFRSQAGFCTLRFELC